MVVDRIVYCVFYSREITPAQIDFLDQWFCHIDQYFYVYGAPKEFISGRPDNVRSLCQFDQADFIAEARQADRVVFSNLFQNIAVVFAMYPEIVKKAIWVPWGPDIYNRCREIPDISSNDARFVFYRQFVRWLQGIAIPLKGDFELIKIFYQTHAKHIHACPNIFKLERDALDSLVKERKRRSNLAIQLGNSADASNRHLEMLDWLSTRRDRDFYLYAPLSYGSTKNAERTVQKGEELFGARFVPMTRFMSHDEYCRHLAGMDVLILNHWRQQGFQNIAISIYLGVKVFVRGDVTTWDYLVNEIGCRIFDTRSIPSLSIEEIGCFDEAARQQNRERIAILFDRRWQRDMWAGIYKKEL